MKNFKTPTAVTTAVLTLITIFFWAGFEVYRSLTIKQVPPVPAVVINPLDPTLDTNTLQKLGQRGFLNDSEIGNIEGVAVSTPSPIVTATPIPTSSASATPVATASQSATPIATP